MEQCCKRVYPQNDGMRFPKARQCSRKAVVTRNGERYCVQHDPEFVAQKNEAQSARWAAESKARRDGWERDRLCKAACDGLTNEGTEELARLVPMLSEIRRELYRLYKDPTPSIIQIEKILINYAPPQITNG